MTIDDRALFKRAQTNAAGFGELFDAYYDRIYKYAYRRVGSRDSADDIAARVFEDALKSIKRVRWQGQPIIAWLYRIAARRIADFYRGRRDEESFDDLTLAASDNVSERVEREDEYAAVRRGIARLHERDREIIRLAFFDELSGAEIAATLGCTANNTYVRLHRALRNLKTILQERERGVR